MRYRGNYPVAVWLGSLLASSIWAGHAWGADAADPVPSQAEKPLAWNRPDRYVAPDFQAFFPEDAEGGRRLDTFDPKKLAEGQPREVLEVVRRGLRTTKQHKTLVLAGVGNRFIWNQRPQEPLAIELMYHASASPDQANTGHYAMYFGLTVVASRSDNLIRTLMQQYYTWDSQIQQRIHWGFQTYGDKQDTLARLGRLLDQHKQLSPETVLAALDAYRKLAGKDPPQAERFTSTGLFVVAFHDPNIKTEADLRRLWSHELSRGGIGADFLARQTGVMLYGMALVRGTAGRDALSERLKQRPGFTVDFTELLTPRTFQSYRVREFAKYLPGGLPLHAAPQDAPGPREATYSWNRADRYVPPDFARFFPDDAEAGAALDRLYASRDNLTANDRQILDTFRRGLRRSKLPANLLFGWIQPALGWPADPYLTEIHYQAADPAAPLEIRYATVYYGFWPSQEHPDNLLRALQQLYVTAPIDRSLAMNMRQRVLWILKSDREKQFFAARLAETLDDAPKLSTEMIYTLYGAYRQLTDKEPPGVARFDRRGLFVVVFRHRDMATVEQLTAHVRQEFSKSDLWVDLLVSSDGQRAQGIALVRGIAGMRWLSEAMKKDRRYMIDVGDVLTAEMVQMPALAAWAKYLR